MAKTPAPAKTPGVAVARVLRGLGLKQGLDFRIRAERKNGERIGTRVAVFGAEANQTVADNADKIEQQAGDAGFHFNVSVYFTPSCRVWVHVANYGERTRQTHFLSATPAEPTETEAPKPAIRATLGAPRPAFEQPASEATALNPQMQDFQKGQRVQGVDSYNVVCMGTVNGVAWGEVTNPDHVNCGRTWVDVTWDEMPHNQGTGRRSRPFTSNLIKH